MTSLVPFLLERASQLSMVCLCVPLIAVVACRQADAPVVHDDVDVIDDDDVLDDDDDDLDDDDDDDDDDDVHWNVTAVIELINDDVYYGEVVYLDGSASSTDGDLPLELHWSIVSTPANGESALSESVGEATSFSATGAGVYEVELVVSAGELQGSAVISVDVLPCVEPHELAGNIDEAEEWVAHRGACPSYIVTAPVRIRAPVLVHPGVRIHFEPSTEMVVIRATDGSLRAEGTADDPIIFEGTEHEKGWWRGLAFRRETTLNRLIHAEVHHAGGDGWDAALIVGGSSVEAGSLRLQDTTVSESATRGLSVGRYGTLTTFADNVFLHNGAAPVRVDINSVDAIDTESIFEDNGAQVVELQGWRLESSATLRDPGIPYLVQDELEIRADLTIEPGVEALFESATGLIVSVGSLRAVGTEDAPILLIGSEHERGWWRGIYFLTEDAKNRLVHVEVGQAGGDGWPAAVRVGGNSAQAASVRLENAAFVDSGSRGLSVSNASELVSFSQNRFIHNTAAPISIDFTKIDKIDTQSTFEDNGAEFVELTGWRLNTPATMRDPGIPYLLLDDLEIRDTFGIEPGVTVHVAPGVRVMVDSAGSLQAIGEEDDPIRFVGDVSEPGSWQGFHLIRQGAAVHTFRHVAILHAGHGEYSPGSAAEPPAAIMVGYGPYSVTASIRDTHFQDIGRVTETNATSVRVWNSNSQVNSDICSANTFADINGPDCIAPE